MARPREFDTILALNKAMHVFWEKGYEATSLTDLTGAMEISKSSFYETFGNKHELYLSAIRHYGQTMIDRAVALLEGEGPALEAIEGMFDAFIDKTVGPEGRKGCMLSNCTVEMASRNGDAKAVVTECLSRLRQGFVKAVARGQAAGEISTTRDAESFGGYLMSSLSGMQVTAKANPDRRALKDIKEVVLSALK